MFAGIDIMDHLYIFLHSDLFWRSFLMIFLIYGVPRIAKIVIPILIGLRHHKEKRVLTSQIQEIRAELSKISQVDEFAKYSRVQRKMRTLVDQYTTISRDDAKLGFEYTLIAQIIIYLMAGLFSLSLAYQYVLLIF